MTGVQGQWVIGVDPGKSGAIALLFDQSLIEVADMPLDVEKRRDQLKRSSRIDTGTLAGMLEAFGDPNRTVVVVEQVTATPQMGVVSAFDFGRSVGIIEGVLFGAGFYDIIWTRPQVWKPAVGLPAGSSKDDSLELARATWPDDVEFFKRKRDNGRAEAALIGLSWWST